MLTAQDFAREAVTRLNKKFCHPLDKNHEGSNDMNNQVAFFFSSGEKYITIYRTNNSTNDIFCYVSINRKTVHSPVTYPDRTIFPAVEISYLTSELETFIKESDPLGNFIKNSYNR